MPVFWNYTDTEVSLAGFSCPAESAVTITDAQARAVAPSLHGVDCFRVEYEANSDEADSPATDEEIEDE